MALGVGCGRAQRNPTLLQALGFAALYHNLRNSIRTQGTVLNSNHLPNTL